MALRTHQLDTQHSLPTPSHRHSLRHLKPRHPRNHQEKFTWLSASPVCWTGNLLVTIASISWPDCKSSRIFRKFVSLRQIPSSSFFLLSVSFQNLEFIILKLPARSSLRTQPILLHFGGHSKRQKEQTEKKKKLPPWNHFISSVVCESRRCVRELAPFAFPIISFGVAPQSTQSFCPPSVNGSILHLRFRFQHPKKDPRPDHRNCDPCRPDRHSILVASPQTRDIPCGTSLVAALVSLATCTTPPCRYPPNPTPGVPLSLLLSTGTNPPPPLTPSGTSCSGTLVPSDCPEADHCKVRQVTALHLLRSLRLVPSEWPHEPCPSPALTHLASYFVSTSFFPSSFLFPFSLSSFFFCLNWEITF